MTPGKCTSVVQYGRAGVDGGGGGGDDRGGR